MAVAYNIDLVSKFLNLLADVYKLESRTARMDAITQSVDFQNANEVKVMKLETVGLGNYSRSAGYPKGNMNATWATMTLTLERGRSFFIDRMDNEESFGLVLGNLIRTWMREHVAPELDATRFAEYATSAGNKVGTGATLSASTILAALDAAELALNEDEVPEEGRVLYITPTCKQYLEAAISRTLANETRANRLIEVYNGMEVVSVPQTRFYTKIALDDGDDATEGGYAKDVGGGGVDINFMIIHPSAVLQPTKLNNLKYFSPEVNQLADGHLFQYRLYHDVFVYPNHENGIYVHFKAS